MREKRMTRFNLHSMMMTRRARRGCRVVVPGRSGEIYPLDVVGLAPLLECSFSTLRVLASCVRRKSQHDHDWPSRRREACKEVRRVTTK